MSQGAGWYPNPLNPSRNIYWDGSQWHYNPETAPTPPPQPPQPSASPMPPAPAIKQDNMVNASRNPIGLILVISGAVILGIAEFLPYFEPPGIIRFVKDNTLIQQGGWILLILAIGIAISGYMAYQRPSTWLRPLISSVIAGVC